MLLMIDAGNTSVKWAMLARASLKHGAAPGEWASSGSIARADVAQLADAWRGADINRVILSNVAGAGMQEDLEKLLSHVLGLKPVPLEWFASVPQLAGVRNAYRNPAQLGCDRFASAIGAHALFPGKPLIVATCGTATTVDAVSADGVFLGGMILPGLSLMASSLARNTAQLPQISAEAKAAIFADNTDDAIASGCMNAQLGAIERAVAALAKQGGEVQCILSGGAAPLIAPHLTMPHVQIDKLVLAGLQVVAAQ
jgi:type III pantothenate kinase